VKSTISRAFISYTQGRLFYLESSEAVLQFGANKMLTKIKIKTHAMRCPEEN
jgi:hypothetical protein